MEILGFIFSGDQEKNVEFLALLHFHTPPYCY